MAIRKEDARTDPIRPEDTMFHFHADQQKLKCFHGNGMMQWWVTAKGIGSRMDFGVNGNTPPGLYELEQPQPISPRDEKAPALGLWFVPLKPFISHDCVKFGRKDIGIHGGGSDLPQPLAPRQGWESTLGCIRVQNQDLLRVTTAVANALGKGHHAWLMVSWIEFVAGRQQIRSY